MQKKTNRVILIVLDSVGCGDAPDAAAFGDEGCNTLGNISRVVGGLNLPNLGKMGLGHTTQIEGVPPQAATGAYGRLTETSAGKDTTIGHWELSGLVMDKPLPVYPNGFPADLIAEYEKRIGRGTLGNCPASGTEILKELGAEHMRTGKPIVYTSADSVFQVAAHEDVISLDEMYRICLVARSLLVGEHAVGRVIARPFIGQPGSFTRTERRRDYSLEPPAPTILDAIKSSGQEVMAVGKIEDIFAHRGITQTDHAGNNMTVVDATLEFMDMRKRGLIFANLVDFDALYGHRNDPRGYAGALEAFDRRLPEIQGRMDRDDVLVITADHGNDPTTKGTDHSRERVPVLVGGERVRSNVNVGTRVTYADLAATIGDLVAVDWNGPGDTFASLFLSDGS
jgi:phosphopentomutase